MTPEREALILRALQVGHQTVRAGEPQASPPRRVA